MKNYLITIFLSILFCMSLMAEDTNLDSLSLEKRVSKIEQRDSMLQLIDQKINAKINESYLTLFIGAIVGLLGIGFIYQKAVKYVDREVENKVATFVQNKQELIADMVKKHETEFRILTQTRLLILSYEHPFDAKSPIYQVLDKFTHRDVTYRTINEYEALHTKKYDVIFFNNSHGNWDDQFSIIYRYLEEDEGAFFYFGSKFLDKKYLNSHLFLGSATFPSQLYGNLINLIKVKQLIHPSQS